jgi:hypothetical protein
LPVPSILAAARLASFSSSSLWFCCFAADRSVEDFTRPNHRAPGATVSMIAECTTRRQRPCKLQWIYLSQRLAITTPKHRNGSECSSLERRGSVWPSLS